MMCGTISMCISNFLANLHQCVLSLPKAISTTTQVLEMTYKIIYFYCWEFRDDEKGKCFTSHGSNVLNVFLETCISP